MKFEFKKGRKDWLYQKFATRIHGDDVEKAVSLHIQAMIFAILGTQKETLNPAYQFDSWETTVGRPPEDDETVLVLLHPDSVNIINMVHRSIWERWLVSDIQLGVNYLKARRHKKLVKSELLMDGVDWSLTLPTEQPSRWVSHLQEEINEKERNSSDPEKRVTKGFWLSFNERESNKIEAEELHKVLTHYYPTREWGVARIGGQR